MSVPISGENAQALAPPAVTQTGGENAQGPAAPATSGEDVRGSADPAKATPGGTPPASEEGASGTPATPEDDATAAKKPAGKDAAFADMRRKFEAAERRAAAAEAEAAKNREALQYFFPSDDPAVDAIAHAKGLPPEEVAARHADQKELAVLRGAVEKLSSEKVSLEVNRAMEKDLAEIRKIDPSVKSLDELGKTFFDLIGTGKVSGIEAYYAVKAREQKEGKSPPPKVGKVDTAPVEKDFYTKEEVKEMSKEQRLKAHEKILSSMKKW
jgi:hypothetical protein